jgi:hypothetical protein
MPADGDFFALWSEIQARERGGNGVFGVKVMYDSWFLYLLPRLKTMPCYAGKEDVEIFKSFFPEPRVMLISRRNKLAQAVSWVKALRIGIWEFRGREGASFHDALVFDFLGIMETMRLPVQECPSVIRIIPGRHPAFRSLAGMTFAGLAELQDNRLRTETQTRLVLRLQVCNLSQFEWPAVGPLDGRLWVLARAVWKPHEGLERRDEGRGYLPHALSPGAEVRVELPLTAPEQPGLYVLELALEQQGVGILGGLAAVITVTVEVQRPGYEDDAEAFFGPLAPLDGGWKRSAWYGELMDWHYPWIFHAEHGWQQCLERQGTVLQLEDAVLGILEIRTEEYPFVKQVSTGRRLRYEPGSGAMRRFQCDESREWVEYPRKEC